MVFVPLDLFVAGSFSSEDLEFVRDIAAKYKKPSDTDRAAYFSKIQKLTTMESLNDATLLEKQRLYRAIKNGEFGGLMDEIKSQLTKSREDLEKVLASSTTTTVSQTGVSTTTVIVPEAATYLDKIASLGKLIESCRSLQTVSDDTKKMVLTFLQGLYDTRGDAFPEEISKIATADDTPATPPLLNNANILVFRGDAQYTVVMADLQKNFLVPVDFLTKLIIQRKLRDFYGSLTASQITRILRHFKIMTDMLSTVTDTSLIDEFKELLKFVNTKFFYNDNTSRNVVVGLINTVAQFDPIFLKTYAEIIIKLKTDSLTLAAADIKPFVEKLKKLINNGYGTKPEDIAAKSSNLKSIEDFLTMLLDLPPFADYVVDIAALLSKVKLDAGSVDTTSNFGDSIKALTTSDRILATKDTTARNNFMTAVKSLMDTRYGQSDKDKTDAEVDLNKRKLLQLFNWIVNIPWFVSSQPDLDAIKNYIKIVTNDPKNAPFPGVSTVITPATVVPAGPVGTFNVSFAEDLDAQLAKLEQSLPAVSSDNHRELFILSLYDAAQRKSGATTANINRMKTIINNIRSSALFGTNYLGFCTFLSGYLDNSTDTALRNQAFLDFMSRASTMTLIVDGVQQRFVDFGEILLNAYPTSFSLAQMSTLLQIIRNVTSKTYFKPALLDDATDLESLVSRKIADAGGAVLPTSTPNPIQTPTQNTTPAPAPVVLTPAQIKANQDKAARDFLMARSNNWR